MIGLIWFNVEDLNVIYYQNMANLHNRHKSGERKMSQKNEEYMEGRANRHNFERNHPRTIPTKFDLRGEDLNVKVYDVRRADGRQVMVKAHMVYDG